MKIAGKAMFFSLAIFIDLVAFPNNFIKEFDVILHTQPLTNMAYFTWSLPTNEGRSLIFHFNRIFTVNGPRYHISVKTVSSTYYFLMQQTGENWEFTDLTNLPAWLIDLKEELELVIVEHIEEVIKNQGQNP